MPTSRTNTVIRHLRRAVLSRDGAGLADDHLLGCFIEHRDDDAFAALVRRHSPLVWAVCRRVLRNHHDAEDAFQATFLVLARKASSVRPRGRVASWLHGVAYRTALKARALRARTRVRERQVRELPEPEVPPQDNGHDLRLLLDQALNGLPEIYRLPILLCDLEGKTIKEATQQLGWPQGTLAGRLARGRRLLAKRLSQRGLVLPAASLAGVLMQNTASAGVPISLVGSTVKAASLVAAGQASVAGVVPAKVSALMEGAMKSMMLTKLRIHAATFGVLLIIFSVGGGLLSHRRAIAQPCKPESVVATPSIQQNTDRDTLRGTWTVISVTALGRQAAPKNWTWKFEDGKLVMNQVLVGYRRQGQDGQEATYHLGGDPDDAEPTPAAIDMTLVMIDSPPDAKPVREGRKTLKGVYAGDGNRLTLCFCLKGNQRPTEIPNEPGRDVAVFVLVKR